jgi:peptidoglycan/xylan/chitin deacetylase (PgdA/CDA1 family)
VIWRSAFALASPGGTRARLSILIFHRVLPQQDPLFPGEIFAEQFAALMSHVASRFRVLALHDAVQALAHGTLPARAMAITFDDGYADNLEIAAPILQHAGIPATVFVATGYLDGSCMWNDLVIQALRATQRTSVDLRSIGLGTLQLGSHQDRRAAIDQVLAHLKYLPLEERSNRAERVLRAAEVDAPRGLMLTRESVRALHSAGFDVGAHTVTHPILARLATDAAWEEIRQSKLDLEALTGKSVALFAYPNGKPGADYSPDHVRMVREAGFEAAFTTAPGAANRDSDIHQLPRFTPWVRNPLRFDWLMMRNLRQDAEQGAA